MTIIDRWQRMKKRAEKRVAASAVYNTTEILENILLHMENGPLLLMTHKARRIRDTIRGSTKLQKKLFFVQPTFQEAVDLGLIMNDSVICSLRSGQQLYLNPLLFDMQLPRARVVASVVLGHEAKQHGSWERMFCSTKIVPDPEDQLFAANHMDAIIREIVIRDRLENEYDVGCRLGSVEFVRSWNTGPMRTIMKGC